MLQNPVKNTKKQPFLQDCPQFDLDCGSCRTLQLQIEPEVSVQHRATAFLRLLLVYFLAFNPLCSPKNTNWAVRLSDPLNDQIKARVHKNTHEQAVVTQPRTKQKSPSGSDLIFLSIWAPHFLMLTLQMKEWSSTCSCGWRTFRKIWPFSAGLQQLQGNKKRTVEHETGISPSVRRLQQTDYLDSLRAFLHDHHPLKVWNYSHSSEFFHCSSEWVSPFSCRPPWVEAERSAAITQQ